MTRTKKFLVTAAMIAGVTAGAAAPAMADNHAGVTPMSDNHSPIAPQDNHAAIVSPLDDHVSVTPLDSHAG